MRYCLYLTHHSDRTAWLHSPSEVIPFSYLIDAGLFVTQGGTGILSLQSDAIQPAYLHICLLNSSALVDVYVKCGY